MYPILSLTIIAVGGIFAATNPEHTSHELAHHFKTSETKYIVTEPQILSSVLPAAENSAIPKTNILVFDNPGQRIPTDFTSYKTLLTHGEADWHRFEDLSTASETPAYRLFSSGTTGLPKAVTLTHHNLVAQHQINWARDKRPYRIRRLLVLPMFHMAIIPHSHVASLKAGQVCIVMRRFDLEGFLANIERFGVTDLAMVPPLVIATIMSPLSRKYSMKSIRGAICGAAPLDKGPQERFQRLLTEGAPFNQVYGMTELTCLATGVLWPEHDATGSIGRLLPNLDVKLIDEEGREVHEFSEPDEVLIRGPTVIPGYLNNAKANSETFDAEGFCHTGDVGFCDEKTGLWYLVDRKKELIKVRGYQVAPPEIVGTILAHPLVVDAAVIGVPAVAVSRKEKADEASGQLPRAYLVRQPGLSGRGLDEDQVKEWVRQRLVRYKWLEAGVSFVDVIPRNASGKILKRSLREIAVRQMGSKLRTSVRTLLALSRVDLEYVLQG